MTNSCPWYDANWLNTFQRAKELVSKHHPQRLSEFLDSFKALRTDADFVPRLIEGAIDVKTLDEIREFIRSFDDQQLEQHELLTFGRLILHNQEYISTLQKQLSETVGEAVNEPVEPCYNFLSLYNNLGVCQVHMDAPEAKWTLDICVDRTAPWPIHISQVRNWPEAFVQTQDDWQLQIKSDPAIHFASYETNPGDGLVFSGSSQWHYRDRIPRTSQQNLCHLIFLHYVPRGTRELVQPWNWATIFDMPELARPGKEYASETSAAFLVD